MIKIIKKRIDNEGLYAEGWKYIRVQKGFFHREGIKYLLTPVLVYRKEVYQDNVSVGYAYRYYNRFGMI